MQNMFFLLQNLEDKNKFMPIQKRNYIKIIYCMLDNNLDQESEELNIFFNYIAKLFSEMSHILTKYFRNIF